MKNLLSVCPHPAEPEGGYKIYKKIANWLKLLFMLFLKSIFLLILLGFSIILESNIYYLKMWAYISCSLVITYQLLNLFLLYKFSNKSTKIPEVFPDFIINWLKEFEIMSSTQESLKEFKNIFYRELLIYIIILILITLFFMNINSVSDGKNIINESVLSSSLIPFFFKLKHSGFKNKRVILFFIGVIAYKNLLNYLGISYGDNIVKALINSHLVVVKMFFILGSISSILLMCNYLLTVYFFIKFSKENLSIPKYLPKFIFNWLKFIQARSKPNMKDIYVGMYLRVSFIYFLVFLMSLFMFYSLSSL